MRYLTKNLPAHQRLKWGKLIFDKIIKNGPTSRRTLAGIKSPDNGKKISRKMLSETINILIDEEIIQELPSKGGDRLYDLSEKFKEKKLTQLLYLQSRENESPMRATLHFEHSIYGLPDFTDLSDNDQHLVFSSIDKIEQVLTQLNRIKGVSDTRLALVSTYPIKRRPEVKKHIELALDELFKQGLRFKKRNAPRLSIGNLSRFEEVIQTVRYSCSNTWVDDEFSVYKFLHHKQLKEEFSDDQIAFMLDVLKELKQDQRRIYSTDIISFIIEMGFNEGGLWFDEKKKYFYKLADDLVHSFDPKTYADDIFDDRVDKIKLKLEEDLTVPPSIVKNEDGEFGLNELICYVDAQLYLRRPREKFGKMFHGEW